MQFVDIYILTIDLGFLAKDLESEIWQLLRFQVDTCVRTDSYSENAKSSISHIRDPGKILNALVGTHANVYFLISSSSVLHRFHHKHSDLSIFSWTAQR